MRILMVVRIRFRRVEDGFVLERALESDPNRMEPILSFVELHGGWWWWESAICACCSKLIMNNASSARGPWRTAWGAVRDARRHGWITMRDVPGFWERSAR
jgi:hypothetical protein